MADDDQPPRAAVEAVARSSSVPRTALWDLRSLPPPQRWALAAWIVRDLEPTQAMTDAGERELSLWIAPTLHAGTALLAMLAAAREATP